MILQATYQMRSEMRSIFATTTRSWVEIAAVSWTNEFSDPCAGHAQKRRWVSSTRTACVSVGRRVAATPVDQARADRSL